MLEHTLALTSTHCRMPGIRNLRPHMWTSASFSALSVAAGLPAAWLRFPLRMRLRQPSLRGTRHPATWPLQGHALCFSGKKWSLLEESRDQGPPAQQSNWFLYGRSLKELSASRSLLQAAAAPRTARHSRILFCCYRCMPLRSYQLLLLLPLFSIWSSVLVRWLAKLERYRMLIWP